MKQSKFDAFEDPSLFDDQDGSEQGRSDEDPSDRPLSHGDVPWEDLEELVPELFDVWMSGGDREWARYAWRAVERQCGGRGQDVLSHAQAVIRLCVLASLNVEFACYAFGNGIPGDWQYQGWDVVGEFPRIDLISLGRLAEREGVYVDGPEEAGGALVCELVRSQHRHVVAALSTEMGDGEIMASLWTASLDDHEFPTPDAVARECLNTDISGEKLRAWNWITEGMPLV